ncbi:hypothetical protein LA59_17630 [Vibrio harveyi]|uniref:hypothetical protein n=1 Tax=Vibrio harveyi TaxID=669 RepID=UPI000539525C|nr:hypothetical protein [Vibrio harveyi]AIV07280.1 hypothetical protein LA59_17630 [Vibrio harveyi]
MTKKNMGNKKLLDLNRDRVLVTKKIQTIDPKLLKNELRNEHYLEGVSDEEIVNRLTEIQKTISERPINHDSLLRDRLTVQIVRTLSDKEFIVNLGIVLDVDPEECYSDLIEVCPEFGWCSDDCPPHGIWDCPTDSPCTTLV